ncbi:MAG: hypothetical protein ABIR38_08800 [Chthoniobacterales bacterium]
MSKIALAVVLGISVALYAKPEKFSDKFGHSKCVILREYARVLVRPFSL